ncbi:MAG: MotA/TolQ/ExbB proton channel family protein [Opitutae bacterium]|nr:MotA/TolQ/ExbB proton channel family protein [Opitutae bacterium]
MPPIFFSAPFLAATEAVSRGFLWYWEQCDGVARAVIGFIAIGSFASWTMIIKKGLDLRDHRKENVTFERYLQSVEKISALRIKDTSPYGKLAAAAVTVCQKSAGRISSRRDVDVCMGLVENAIQRALSRQTTLYEKYLVALSTCVSGGPFCGLFGTVWGVIVTFGSLTEKATISQLAPGVAGALLATLSGLALAIPSLIAYNALLTKAKLMTSELENFASLTADRIENELIAGIHDEAERKQPATGRLAVDMPTTNPATTMPASATFTTNPLTTNPATTNPRGTPDALNLGQY